MKRSLRTTLLPVAMLLLAACGRVISNESDQTLFDYAGTIRWSDFETAWTFVDPVFRKDHPLTDLEFERYKLIQVTGYDVKGDRQNGDGSFDQLVEIRYVGKLTQVEHSVLDHQHWRWDATQRHWWLTSGLPDFTHPDR